MLPALSCPGPSDLRTYKAPNQCQLPSVLFRSLWFSHPNESLSLLFVDLSLLCVILLTFLHLALVTWFGPVWFLPQISPSSYSLTSLYTCFHDLFSALSHLSLSSLIIYTLQHLHSNFSTNHNAYRDRWSNGVHRTWGLLWADYSARKWVISPFLHFDFISFSCYEQ